MKTRILLAASAAVLAIAGCAKNESQNSAQSQAEETAEAAVSSPWPAFVDAFLEEYLPMNPTFYEYDLSAPRNDFGYTPTMSVQEIVDEALKFRETGAGDIIPTHV